MNHINKKINIVFWGNPELTIPYLEKLYEQNYNIVALVTAPDRKVGRKQVLTPPPSKVWAQEHGIVVFQSEKIDEDLKQKLINLEPVVFIVVAYGKILPQDVIDIPTHGTLNVHYSLLPRWRGASPIESAILAGDHQTGVSIQKMIYQLDAGDIVASQAIHLNQNEFAQELKSTLSIIGANLLTEILPKFLSGAIKLIPQDKNLITQCTTIQKSQGEVSLTMSHDQLWKKYRAYFGWPGIFFFDSHGKRIKITDACFVDGVFETRKVIPEGKKEIAYTTFVSS